MGHVRLPVLATTRKWRQVVQHVAEGADVEVVASAAAEAAERDLTRASRDPAFLQAFWLLTQIPLAARGPELAADLGRLDVHVSEAPTLMELAAAISAAVDRHARATGGRTDLGEMAQMAAVESLTALVGRDLPSLFAARPEDVQHALGRYASGERFSQLARAFFSRLTQRTLRYYLDRELSNHIGAGRRFGDDAARSRFAEALDRHCWETTRIVEAFAGGWYGKNVYQGAGLTPEAVARFAPVAFRKIRAELRKRRDAEA